MDLPNVNPGDLIKAADINKISSSLADLLNWADNGRLTPVAAGTGVTLPADADVGDLHGYSLEGVATFNDAPLAAGDYVFRKTATGWDYRKLADATVLTVVPDTTGPTAGTLASSAITHTGFTLTASGVSDNRVLHNSPYAFSPDGGTTWSAWQSSATYNVGGLTASTGYVCLHRVRDAAANVTLGAPIMVTTSRIPSGTVLASDSFNRADGPLGNSDGPGAIPWSTLTPTFTVSSGEAANVSGQPFGTSVLDVGQTDMRVTFKNADSVVSKALVARCAANGGKRYEMLISTSGWSIRHATVFGGANVVPRHNFTRAFPAIGDTVGLEVVTNGAAVDFTAYHNGAVVATYTETNPTYIITTGTHAGMWSSNTGRVDDFEVTVP